MKNLLFLSIVVFLFALKTNGQQKAPKKTILFTNVMVFDGTTNQLLKRDVLIENNLIKQVSEEALAVIQTDNVTVIDGKGMTLMPGLIDSHVHFNLQMPGGIPAVEGETWEYIATYAASAAREHLYNGFTTARDMGGMHDGMRKVIEAGALEGPRLYLAGGFLSQTSGHGDFRFKSTYNASESNTVRLGISRIVDGRDEMLKATRQNLSLGADYFKVMISLVFLTFTSIFPIIKSVCVCTCRNYVRVGTNFPSLFIFKYPWLSQCNMLFQWNIFYGIFFLGILFST